MTISEAMGHLIIVLAAGLTGFGGLIVWAVKSAFPPILETFRARTKAITDAVDRVPALVTAVEKIPAALDRFEVRLAQSEERIVSKVEERRVEALTEELRRIGDAQPASVPPPRRRNT